MIAQAQSLMWTATMNFNRMSQNVKKGYWMAVTAAASLLVCIAPVMADDDIWSRAKTLLNDLYLKLVGISTLIAVVAAAIAFIIRTAVKSQRAVDEANAWLWRIALSWVTLNCLGLIVAYLAPLVAGGTYVPDIDVGVTSTQ